MKIVQKPKRKRKTTAYYYWMAVELPRRKKRLAQLNKANHISRKNGKRSEMVEEAERYENARQ